MNRPGQMNFWPLSWFKMVLGPPKSDTSFSDGKPKKPTAQVSTWLQEWIFNVMMWSFPSESDIQKPPMDYEKTKTREEMSSAFCKLSWLSSEAKTLSSTFWKQSCERTRYHQSRLHIIFEAGGFLSSSCCLSSLAWSLRISKIPLRTTVDLINLQEDTTWWCRIY